MGCAGCSGADPDEAFALSRALELRARLADESHFDVLLLRCAGCAQDYVSVFCETIDWAGGNDPQDWMVIPLTPEEADALAAAGEAGLERAIGKLPARRYLVRWFPAEAGVPSARWVNGVISVPRHD